MKPNNGASKKSPELDLESDEEWETGSKRKSGKQILNYYTTV